MRDLTFRRRRVRDRGSVAVEFALLLPLLLLIVFGLIDFGRALNAQTTLTTAARTGAREAALGYSNPLSDMSTSTHALSHVVATITYCPAVPVSGDSATVTLTYPFTFITPLGAVAKFFGNGSLGSGLTLTATAVMPCEVT